MSLQVRIESLVQRLASVFKTVDTQMGNLDGLSTADKSSLVGAINELREQLAQGTGGNGGETGGGAGNTSPVIVDDNASATSTTFSAAKITSLLDALKADLLGGTDAAFDTLKELQQAIEQDQSGLRAVLEALDARLRVDTAQSLTSEQQAQVRRNIGAQDAHAVGNTETDFVAVFETALGRGQTGGVGNDTVGGAGGEVGGETGGEVVTGEGTGSTEPVLS